MKINILFLNNEMDGHDDYFGYGILRIDRLMDAA